MVDDFGPEGNHEEFKFRKIELPDDEEMRFITHRLVPEQMDVLRIVVQYCKDVVKRRENLVHPVTPLKIVVHGGAGN